MMNCNCHPEIPAHVCRFLNRLPDFYDKEGSYGEGSGTWVTEEGWHVFDNYLDIWGTHVWSSDIAGCGLDEEGRFAKLGGFLGDDSSNVFKFSVVVSDQYKNISTYAARILASHQIDFASGITLDYFARLLGLERGDLIDEELRRYIKSAVTGLVGGGTDPNLRSALGLVYGIGSGEITIYEPAAATITVVVPSYYTTINPNLWSLIIKYKAAGIAFNVETADLGVWDVTDWDECVWTE